MQSAWLLGVGPQAGMPGGGGSEPEETEGETRLEVCVGLAFDASVGADCCWVRSQGSV